MVEDEELLRTFLLLRDEMYIRALHDIEINELILLEKELFGL